MARAAEQRVDLINKKLQEPRRMMEIKAGRMALALREFEVLAGEKWPRLSISTTVYYKHDRGRTEVELIATVKGEKKICYEVREPFDIFPSELTLAMLGLVG